MSLFHIGQRIEYKHESAPRIYRGTLVGWSRDKHYSFVGEHGKIWLVSRRRLQHIGGCARQGRA